MNPQRREQLETAIATALTPFVPVDKCVPGTKAAIVLDVANYAEAVITIMCGDPDAPAPQGILDGPRKLR